RGALGRDCAALQGDGGVAGAVRVVRAGGGAGVHVRAGRGRCEHPREPAAGGAGLLGADRGERARGGGAGAAVHGGPHPPTPSPPLRRGEARRNLTPRPPLLLRGEGETEAVGPSRAPGRASTSSGRTGSDSL